MHNCPFVDADDLLLYINRSSDGRVDLSNIYTHAMISDLLERRLIKSTDVSVTFYDLSEDSTPAPSTAEEKAEKAGDFATYAITPRGVIHLDAIQRALTRAEEEAEQQRQQQILQQQREDKRDRKDTFRFYAGIVASLLSVVLTALVTSWLQSGEPLLQWLFHTMH